jgi:hypothetical protein
MIVGWINLIESRLNRKIQCPLKAGALEYNAGRTPQKAMKEITPMFIVPKDKENEFSFLIKVTLLTKFGGKFENIAEYKDYGFKISLL